MEKTMTDDLSIPDFLRTTGPGRPCEYKLDLIEPERMHGYGPSCWEEMKRPEWSERQDMKDAIDQYKAEKSFAEFQQWVHENPELAKMNAKAKRDARRRIACMGIPPAKRRGR